VKTNAQLQTTSARKVLGLFNPGNMTTEWNGQLAQTVRTGPQRCNEAFRATTAPNEPRLADMTSKAISLLEKAAKRNRGDEGFFLQVEGASIDKQDHASNPCAQIGETVEFDRAVQVALAYAKKHPDTLVIVTADHSHTSQIIPQAGASPGRTSVLIGTDAAPGETSCVVPSDGRASTAPGCITVNYATSTGGSQAHTGSTVRVAAVGPQAANVLGLVDQTELFDLMNRALRH
jgi:alkaline phosphatase